MPITHSKVSGVDDVGIPDAWVKPSDWNDEHVLDGALAQLDSIAPQPNKVPYFDGAGAGATFDVSAFVRSLMNSADATAFLALLNAAALNSPAFTGTPTAPTAASNVNTTQIATTAFVQAVVANLVAGSPALLDTLNELAAALGNDPNFATTMTNALALKAPLNSPALTGTPTAPTVAGTADSSTKIATTAFVQAVAALLAPLASPALTGTPTAPTAANGTSTTQLATTAFVQAALAAIGAVAYFPPQGRLTVTSGTPVLTAATTGNTSVYYTPYVGDLVTLYNGTALTSAAFTELAQALSDTTKSPAAAVANSNYDLFVWNDAGTLRLSRGPAWTSSTARGTGAGTTELVRVKGLWLNANAITNGPAAQRGTYVGTVRTRAADAMIDWHPGGAASGGTAAQLMVWNAYNRVTVSAQVTDSGASYTYAGGAPRQARASAGNQINVVIGLAEDGGDVTYMARGTTAAVQQASMGWTVGIDSTTVSARPNTVLQAAAALGLAFGAPNAGAVTLGIGYHFLAALEFADGTNAATFNASGNNVLSAIFRM